jgi:predicted RNA-binding Zn-ribbon protein involved in translation (DUF1610 family)
MVRSSKHSLRFTNAEKLNKYSEFISEYRRVAYLYLDYLWENGWNWKSKDKQFILDIINDKLDHPRMIDKEINKKINLQTTLSARALKCCITQVCGIIGASLEKRRRILYRISKLKSENKPTSFLEKKLQPIVKPYIFNINPELNSICCDFQSEDLKFFNGFFQLKSIGKSFGKIRIPIKFHRGSNKWNSKCRMMTSFSLSNKNLTIRWENIAPEKKTEGIIVGADQGMKDVLTLSNESVTKKVNNHGHSLESVIKVLERKKKGSKAFRKTQEHRKNIINWSINSLSFGNIKEIRLEKIVNIGYGKRQSRKMFHWTNTLIRDKVISTCEELGVLVIQQDAIYRSQRCSSCGQVRKANRKGKTYLCKNCGLKIDSDLNAAKNHEQDLPKIPFELRRLRKNLGEGFLWKPNGFFEMAGEEFTVSLSKNEH